MIHTIACEQIYSLIYDEIRKNSPKYSTYDTGSLINIIAKNFPRDDRSKIIICSYVYLLNNYFDYEDGWVLKTSKNIINDTHRYEYIYNKNVMNDINAIIKDIFDDPTVLNQLIKSSDNDLNRILSGRCEMGAGRGRHVIIAAVLKYINDNEDLNKLNDKNHPLYNMVKKYIIDEDDKDIIQDSIFVAKSMGVDLNKFENIYEIRSGDVRLGGESHMNFHNPDIAKHAIRDRDFSINKLNEPSKFVIDAYMKGEYLNNEEVSDIIMSHAPNLSDQSKVMINALKQLYDHVDKPEIRDTISICMKNPQFSNIIAESLFKMIKQIKRIRIDIKDINAARNVSKRSAGLLYTIAVITDRGWVKYINNDNTDILITLARWLYFKDNDLLQDFNMAKFLAIYDKVKNLPCVGGSNYGSKLHNTMIWSLHFYKHNINIKEFESPALCTIINLERSKENIRIIRKIIDNVPDIFNRTCVAINDPPRVDIWHKSLKHYNDFDDIFTYPYIFFALVIAYKQSNSDLIENIKLLLITDAFRSHMYKINDGFSNIYLDSNKSLNYLQNYLKNK